MEKTRKSGEEANTNRPATDVFVTSKSRQEDRTTNTSIQNTGNVFVQCGGVNNIGMEKHDEERKSNDHEYSSTQGQGSNLRKLPLVTRKMLSLLALCKPEVPLPVGVLLLVEECAVERVRGRLSTHRSEIKDLLNLSFDPFDDSNSDEVFCLPEGKCNDWLSAHACECNVLDMEKWVFSKLFCEEDDKDWDLLNALLPHLDNWFSHAEKCGIEEELPIHFLCACLHAFGKFRCDGWGERARLLAEKCIEYCESSGSDVSEKERTHREIGEYYRKVGKHEESEKHLNIALEIGKAKSDLASYSLQITEMYLARCKIDKGEHREAEDLINKCLSSPAIKDLEEKGERPYLRGRMYFEKARCYHRLQKYTEAYDACYQALTVEPGYDSFRYPQYLMHCAQYKALKELESEHPNTAVLNEALADCDRAETFMKKRHGDKHHQMAQLLCIQVTIWLGKKDREVPLMRASIALDIMKQKYGQDHNNVAKVYNLLGDIHCEIGNIQKAEKAYKMAIFIYGEEHSLCKRIKEKVEELKESQGILFDPETCDRERLDKELKKP